MKIEPISLMLLEPTAKIVTPETLLLDPTQLCGMLDWGRVFGNDGPVELELGAGKGRFIRACAAAHPERNYLAVERARKYARILLQRAVRDGLANLRQFIGDAPTFLAEHVPDQSLSALYIFYTDPWPKKRHHKRRLINLETAAPLLVSKLRAGGRLEIKTDFAEMFAEIETLIRAQLGLRVVEAGAVTPERFDPALRTNYEVKTVTRGAQVFYLQALKHDRA